MRIPDRLIALFLFLLSLAVYAPSIEGEFVYDDRTQIENNQLIQRPENYARALGSDVFAFAEESHLGGSPYWRPTFIAWLIGNYRLFGADPVGWHVTNMLLHGLVTVLGFYLLRRVGASELLAAGAAFVFAVHPVHVESVVWISGVTDPLLAVFLFTTLLLVLRIDNAPTPGTWIAALGAYALALGAKEPAILFPLVILMGIRNAWGKHEADRQPWRRSIRIALPFAGLALAYLCVRAIILKSFWIYTTSGGPLEAAARNVFTAPAAIAFYIKQTLLPFWPAPAHPLRAIRLSDAGWMNFAVPLALLLLAAVLIDRFAGRNKLANFGGAMFLLPLIPALNVAGFQADTAVHDRYLYVPLLGAVAIMGAIVNAAASRAQDLPVLQRTPVLVLGLFGCVCAGVTVWYGQIWMTESAMWDAAVASDPKALWARVERSRIYEKAERLDEAAQDVEVAYKLAPLDPSVILRRAEIATARHHYSDAAADLQFFLAKVPESAAARVRLGIAYQRSGQLDQAINTFRVGREIVPTRYCDFTVKMAMVMGQAGRTEAAIAELESIRTRLATDTSSDARIALQILGRLYRTIGETGKAQAAEKEFLALSEGVSVPAVVAARARMTPELHQ